MAGRRSLLAALQAIDEVGNPTILATFTVIASVLPMAFVRGLMGPYMRPMPVGASLAMLFSLFIALVVAPWLAVRLLGHKDKDALDATGGFADDPEFAAKETGYHLHDTRIYKIYSRLMAPLIADGRKRLLVLGSVALLTVAVSLLFATRTVQVKMLPFDNKSEFQVIVDMPEGTTLERTTEVAREIGDYLSGVPEVADYQAVVADAGEPGEGELLRVTVRLSGAAKEGAAAQDVAAPQDVVAAARRALEAPGSGLRGVADGSLRVEVAAADGSTWPVSSGMLKRTIDDQRGTVTDA